MKADIFWFNSAGIPTNDLMNKKYKKKQNNLGPINSTLRQLSDASDVLFCGALCRRKNRAEDGGAEEDYQCWIQDTCVPPLSDRAQEDDACGRGQGHLCIQTVHTQLKFWNWVCPIGSPSIVSVVLKNLPVPPSLTYWNADHWLTIQL